MQFIFRPLLLAIFIIASNSLTAQKKMKDELPPYSVPEWNIRSSLTSWLDYDAGVMLGIGYRWNTRFSVALEPTFIFYSLYDEIRARDNPSGIKVRTDVKYYPNERILNLDELFLGFEFHYKNVGKEREGRFAMNCVNGQCAYFQEAIYRQIKQERGVIFKLGFLTSLPFTSDPRWLLEFYAGVGAKSQSFSNKDIPPGGTFIPGPPSVSPLFNENEGLPVLPVGVKLLFLLTKN